MDEPAHIGQRSRHRPTPLAPARLRPSKQKAPARQAAGFHSRQLLRGLIVGARRLRLCQQQLKKRQVAKAAVRQPAECSGVYDKDGVVQNSSLRRTATSKRLGLRPPPACYGPQQQSSVRGAAEEGRQTAGKMRNRIFRFTGFVREFEER